MSNNPAQTKSWQKLKAHRQALDDFHLRAAFEEDPARADRLSLSVEGIFADFSKNLITDETVSLLVDLAKEQKLEEWRDKMFAGVAINHTEKRAVLHTALRRPAGDNVIIEGENILPFIQSVLSKMRIFSENVRSGNWTGYTGKPIKTIVNIGIGGSDLGPYMVCEALKFYANPDQKVLFVSNVDGTHICQTLDQCDPETTLFIIASKTFTTQETMANAQTAKEWLLNDAKDGSVIEKHFVALSTNEQAVTEFGIAAENMFPFRDWVGGRYSLWSAIGLSISIAIGHDKFEELLAGAHAMDTHFCNAPLDKNLPVLMGLIGLWYRNFHDFPALAVLPYDQSLHRFPAFLQQLDMESNGKSVDREGKPITDYQTGPIVFGEPGTNGQHAFYQLIHQGTTIIPCDFIGVRETNYPAGDHHHLLLNNMLAQGQALMQGRTLEEASGDSNRVFPGNRPSTTLIIDRLDPYHLGMLIALYEQKVFVQGVLWNINSFDQFGVELGKELAKSLESGNGACDASTQNLKDHLRP